MDVRVGVRVEGVVQGVGFRPFVHGLATGLGLSGLVGNDAGGVFIEVEGAPETVGRFLDGLRADPPRLAVVERLTTRELDARGRDGFAIVRSDAAGERRALVSWDSATCDDCLRELRDPADRRHGYPFINCTNCGPRFTIVTDVPYDRPNTTMAGFAMCGPCAAEYADPADRRFHAQPLCCPACGPSLSLLPARPASPSSPTSPPGRPSTSAAASAGSPTGPPVADAVADPLAAARAMLADGAVLAVKGVGGYHLAARAADADAVAALRSRKHREDKPFAVMVADLAAARAICLLDETEEALLTGPRRPIVLARRRPDAPLADAVAPGNEFVGLMLPYTPLHHLLVTEPLVLTSGNVSDEPIAYQDRDARERLGGIADAFLLHDRPIQTRTDDSVVRAFRGRPLPVRRSRGYAPEPVPIARGRSVLACGAELKNTFCLTRDGRAFISHHIGDLENYETLRAYEEGIDHFRRLFDIAPELLAYDPHPEYLSTKYALGQELPLIAVQHHHAHIASCLADNRVDGPVIGVAFDGTGFGTDGTLWGGEFLVADLHGFERAGHLEPVPMPGGVAAIREPWRMAAAYGVPDDLPVARRPGWATVAAMAQRRVNAPLTSSMGRLFDAVAAVLGIRDRVNYEGQAAIELEQRADPSESAAYRASINGTGDFTVTGADLVGAVVADIDANVPVPLIAARFHNGVAALIVDAASRVRDGTGLGTVALSGGVFQNMLLLERAVSGLTAAGFDVLTHHRVPPNDGGISLGQAAVATALSS
ncbi:carbamoyltransferase HypF [Actinomadura sp. KC345]|uniref:carbamoyltransferase HypF n=1 Tax=Actinomadura sp. KC345 TaxID=2530371 RepID=UPI001042E4D0|nr:carbamoyltransferase HypF [Actinomadura sp. KC345]TDC47809.1 carbamoyltransferase HypF [Actinomadura sp. KC345]